MTSFSIAMGTYNGARYLREQLKSISAQDYAPKELIVGDDGSTDDTIAILEDFARRSPFPVMITKNRRQLGYGENFLQTASRCTADWVAFCDQDDVWLPNKLALCAETIASAPSDLGLIVHGVIVGDEQLHEIGRMEWPKAGEYDRLTLPPDWLVQGFRQVFRRSLLTDMPFSHRHLSWIGEPEAHDAWVCLTGSIMGSVTVLADCLAIYRRHESNTTEIAAFGPRNVLERVRGKIRDNSAKYNEQASVYRAIATFLTTRATPEMAVNNRQALSTASQRMSALSETLETRARITAGCPLRFRVQAFGNLVRSGAYSAQPGWGFGLAEAGVDLVRVFLPRI